VAAIEAAIKEGDASALNIRSLYELYRACPSDPSAPALCKAALNEWLRTRPDPLVVVGDIVERIGKSVIEAAEPGDDTKVAHTCDCGSDSVSQEAGCSQCSCGAESYDSDPRKLKPESPSPERRLVLAELTVGTPLKVLEGFSCLVAGTVVKVKRDPEDRAFYVECACGKHFLDGDSDTLLEGFEWAVTNLDDIVGRILVLATKGYEAAQAGRPIWAENYFHWIKVACDEAGFKIVPPKDE